MYLEIARGRTSLNVSQKYFPIASMARYKSGDHSAICIMAFALKGKVLEISHCGRGHYVIL